jgi:hypothetical protein
MTKHREVWNPRLPIEWERLLKKKYSEGIPRAGMREILKSHWTAIEQFSWQIDYQKKNILNKKFDEIGEEETINFLDHLLELKETSQRALFDALENLKTMEDDC